MNSRKVKIGMAGKSPPTQADKARKTLGIMSTYKVRRNDEGKTQPASGGQMDFLRSH